FPREDDEIHFDSTVPVPISNALTKYATALIRNSDGETNDISGIIKFHQVREARSNDIFFFKFFFQN
mgnify:CR=1